MYNYVIKKMKNIQLELLNEVDKICTKNNIKYQLFAGTLLGAVRHKGFIPWDDDIDICMKREDYEKFIVVANKELTDEYFLDYPKNDNGAYAYAKLRHKNTEMIEEYTKNIKINHGIFIDIFQMDKVFPNTIRGKLHMRKLNKLHNVRAAKINSYHKNFIKRFIKKIYNLIYRKPYNYYVKKIDQVASKYKNSNSEYVAHLTCMRMKKNYSGFIYNIEDFENPIYLEFEGRKYPTPRRYHELLTMEYGDYMTPPPIDKRKAHHGVLKISFEDESYDIYEENGELKAKKNKS